MNNNFLFNYIKSIRNILNVSGNVQREKKYQQKIYDELVNNSEIRWKQEVSYNDVYFKKRGFKPVSCRTDIEGHYKGREILFEIKFNATKTEHQLNQAFGQCLMYGVYKHRDCYVIQDNNNVYVMFYDENKKYIKRYHNEYISLTKYFSPREIGKKNKENFNKYKRYTFKITPSFTMSTVINFIKNHYA